MNVTEKSLQAVDAHWAVQALGDNIAERAVILAQALLVERALGRQIAFDFAPQPDGQKLLERTALAYEMAAIEGLPAITRPTTESRELRAQCAAGAFRTFEITRSLPLPEKKTARIFHVLHLSALAYCGDRWSDLRRWYKENPNAVEIPSVAEATWDYHLLYRLFDCWIRLLRKSGWDDLDRVREIIAGLRQDQKVYEKGVLDEIKLTERSIAFRLISLYHWAKGTELLALYMLQGEPIDILTLLDKHFETAVDAATASGDAQFDVILRWLHATARLMVNGSLWWVARSVNSRVTRFVGSAIKRGMFELLPPQRAALQEQGLLDQAATAVVVEMPTSGGKTLLAQFRMLQALNQFDEEKGWVAYVAPTRALASQIARRLRRDFEPIGVRVEQLSGAVEIDAFEEQLLTDRDGTLTFSVLVSTPEKLHLVIRNKKVSRPLALVVMDEAHNIENENRGLRIELLLATVKRDCARANFLLLMPFVEKAEAIADWLAQDLNAGRAISFGTTPWQPNDRIIGTYRVEAGTSEKGAWQMVFDTITTSPKALHLAGSHKVGRPKPLKVTKSKLLNEAQRKQSSFGLQTAAMATVMSERGTSIAVANRIDSVWAMAREATAVLPEFVAVPDEVRLVQNFLETEVSPKFELIGMLEKGVGVHHAGLSDEIRTLMEWLTEEGKLRVLCATSTIAQGINFPVSSVFLASRFVPQEKRSTEMSPRDFWNLAGRAGRMNHDSVGVVGLADANDRHKIVEFVSKATGALASRLVTMLDELEKAGRLHDLITIIHGDQWEDFRCYVAHLWAEKKRLDAVLADTEQLLRNTYGYGVLRSSPGGKAKADVLLEVTRAYAKELEKNSGHAELADSTGFSPEGVRKALIGLSQLERKLTPSDWAPESLFGKTTGMADLFGVMLRVPQLAQSLRELSGEGIDHKHLADITKAWVNGSSLQEIAETYFAQGGADTEAFTSACKAIYKAVVNSGTWGVSALSKLSGFDFEKLSDADKRRLNALPAMIYHGVRTEAAVLMRMNSVPRSAAEKLGEQFLGAIAGQGEQLTIQQARRFLRGLEGDDWEKVRPDGASLSGSDYRRVWGVLSGEAV